MMVEDVSASLVPGVYLKAFCSKTDGADWQEIPLTEYLPSWGRGEIDNTKDIRTFAGSAAFVAGAGKDVRYCVKSFGGCLPALQGATTFWDC
jgi:hypothetical protein